MFLKGNNSVSNVLFFLIMGICSKRKEFSIWREKDRFSLNDDVICTLKYFLNSCVLLSFFRFKPRGGRHKGEHVFSMLSSVVRRLIGRLCQDLSVLYLLDGITADSKAMS